MLVYKDQEVVLSPVHHVDPFQVDQCFADLQTEEQQGGVCQHALVLCQIVAQLREGHKTQEKGST